MWITKGILDLNISNKKLIVPGIVWLCHVDNNNYFNDNDNSNNGDDNSDHNNN